MRGQSENSGKQRSTGMKIVQRIFLLLLFSYYSWAASVGDSPTPPVDGLMQKSVVTILVTDSGLGGLSVCAELEKGFRLQGTFRRVRLVFANALPDVEHTYNAMPTRKEQLRVLDAALEGMIHRYSPDILLIACNTLSVLYPDTRFAAAARLPVLGIVEFGTSVLAEKVRQSPSSSLIILGTPTTIREASHRRQLLAAGIGENQIISQACRDLEGEIQADPKSDVVQSLIETYSREALSQFRKPPPGPIIVGLCCSHYGYSKDLFRQVMQEVAGVEVQVVDPNLEMSRFLIGKGRLGRFPPTITSVEVVSRALISPPEQQAIASLLAMISPATAEALKKYRWKKNLFPFPPPQ